MSNPFDEAEAWGTSTDQYLPAGNFVCTISEAEDATAESTSNPQVFLLLVNPQGTAKTWVPYHGEFLQKVVELFDSAGVDRPVDGEFDPNDRFRISKKKIAQLVDTKVGVVIRPEQGYKDPSKTYNRVQGFVKPDQITQDTPIDTTGLPTVGVGSAIDDDIPF